MVKGYVNDIVKIIISIFLIFVNVATIKSVLFY